MRGESRSAIIVGAVCTCLLVLATAVLTFRLYQGSSAPVLAAVEPSVTPSLATATSEPVTATAIPPTQIPVTATPVAVIETPAPEPTVPQPEPTPVPVTPTSTSVESETEHPEDDHSGKSGSDDSGKSGSDDPAEAETTTLPPLAQKVIATQQELHTGVLEAVVTSVTGDRTIVRVRFELSDAHNSMRAQINATSESTVAQESVELLTIGDFLWQRQANGGWQPISPRSEIWANPQLLLPNLMQAVDVRVSDDVDLAGLLWYDPQRDADQTLVVDPANGLPLGLHSVPRTSGSTFTVTYRNWNGAVDIASP